MCPQLSTMWGRSTIKEVREKHVVTFFLHTCWKRQWVHLLLFFLHTMVLRRWSLCLLSECFSFLVSSFSRLSFFGMRAVESSRPVLTRKVIMMMLSEAWGFFFCLFFCFSFSHQFEWSCAEGSEDAQKGKTRRQTPGEELWYDCIADWRNAKPWWATVVASNCFPHRRPSCFHINQVWHLKRHVPDSKEAHTNHYHCYVVNSGLINWPACVVCVFEGESRLPVIQTNVQSAIDGTMSMFCLGFGNNVDYPFLDVMCRQNKGFARRIFEGSDAALQLQVH